MSSARSFIIIPVSHRKINWRTWVKNTKSSRKRFWRDTLLCIYLTRKCMLGDLNGALCIHVELTSSLILNVEILFVEVRVIYPWVKFSLWWGATPSAAKAAYRLWRRAGTICTPSFSSALLVARKGLFYDSSVLHVDRNCTSIRALGVFYFSALTASGGTLTIAVANYVY